MDDLLDLNWSGGGNSNNNKNNSKSNPPSIPHKPSYLAGNRTASRNNNDAFAELLKMPSKNGPDRSQLPLAEQQRLLHQQQSYSSSSSLSARSSSPVKKPASSFDILLDPFNGKRSETPSTANLPLDSLRNSARGFDSQRTQQQQQQQHMQWDFDFLERTTASSSPAATDPFDPASLPVRQSAPPAFAEEDDDDDNPLGILSKPAQELHAPSGPTSPSAQHHSPSLSSSPGRTSPPHSAAAHPCDGFVAQLLDMGFSVEQAHVALAATGGNDLQQAIDLLVQSTEAIEIQDRPRSRRQQGQHHADPQHTGQMPLENYDDEGQKSHRFRQGQSASRQNRHNDRSDTHPPEANQKGPTSNVTFQQQKEKIVAQATELGGYLYKNASMLVKTGRQRVSKAVEDWQEQQRAYQDHRESGRPRWLREGTLDEEDQSVPEERYTERFVDDSSSEEDPELEKQRELAWKKQQEAKQREYAIQARRQQHQKNLIQEEEAYVSPSRRRNIAPSSRRLTPVATSASKTSTSPPPKINKRPRTRPLVSAAPDVMARANAARQLGNEKFKLGQFGEAEAAYSRAISILPAGHDHLVILNNNRAAARLKIGEYKKCIEDCILAIEMALAGGDEQCESDGITIQWREQIIKALYRKAEALENIEKYKDATDTYEEILRYEGQSPKINQALARCRRAATTTVSNSTERALSNSERNTGSAFPGVDYSIFDPEPAAPRAPTKIRSLKQATRSPEANVERSKAVAAMRAQAAKQEAEEAERLEKTDDVNARIQQWKSGKENNLRALLATLDTLLWPGAQWRGAQMSELIEPKRCKMVYLKAIAKVHPDKLPSDVTTEQRMLASSIFSTLNEAWDSFKSQM